jgi:hypothetical protein
VKQVSAAFAAAALAATVGFGSVDAAYADISGLTPCADSKAYAKVQKKELKGLEKRLKQVTISAARAAASCAQASSSCSLCPALWLTPNRYRTAISQLQPSAPGVPGSPARPPRSRACSWWRAPHAGQLTNIACDSCCACSPFACACWGAVRGGQRTRPGPEGDH